MGKLIVVPACTKSEETSDMYCPSNIGIVYEK
jgi:hypothetical protein